MTGAGERQRSRRSSAAVAALLAACLWPGASRAGQAQPAGTDESVAQFYRGKQITILVGSGVGGGYDAIARLLARHMGKHLPGHPGFIVQNLASGGGLVLANAAYNTAAKDGTVIALPLRNIMMVPISRPENARFDLARFNWLGNLGSETPVSFAWHTAKVKTADDLFREELITGANMGADTDLTPRLYNATVGTKFKLINGYLGTTQIVLAMERGEVEAIGDWSWSSFKIHKKDWLKNGTIRALLQGGLRKHPELPDVPNVLDYAKTDLDRQVLQLFFAEKEIARPVMAPPGVPADRLAALRAALVALATDQDFLQDAKHAQMELDLSPGEAVERTVALITSSPPEVSARLLKALTP